MWTKAPSRLASAVGASVTVSFADPGKASAGTFTGTSASACVRLP